MGRVRSERVTATRARIMSAAERLFAEQGVSAVSNRQISEAAGQGNNYAVGYHFGGRLELMRAILEHHNAEIEPLRRTMIDQLGPTVEVRDWIACLVAPQTDYLDSLGTPTYFARFCAQITIDPQFGTLLYEQAAASDELIAVLTGMYASLPTIPKPVLESRDAMARNMILLTLADHERACAAGGATGSWSGIREQLIDALVGIWLAPVTHDAN
ncbi:TetR family transcriptional regulator [Gordonia sp. SID5947]|uniref:TetR/AcrR family transcriptional regulator n=1 Tax=Gordonia sp. SID5947 TaxID=2690315 RepID=UPI00136C3E00|nr:TetR family transcriptional regulator [Gordonia sp. SID5947]MYR06644.1 TetR family transcriptional regulator [Gordonia sp. SID5947]